LIGIIKIENLFNCALKGDAEAQNTLHGDRVPKDSMKSFIVNMFNIFLKVK